VLLEVLVGDGGEPSLELILRHGRERLLERYWLPSREAGGVGIQICPPDGACSPGDGACERTLAQEAELRRAVEENAARPTIERTQRRVVMLDPGDRSPNDRFQKGRVERAAGAGGSTRVSLHALPVALSGVCTGPTLRSSGRELSLCCLCGTRVTRVERSCV
jgi:hypothetical protein